MPTGHVFIATSLDGFIARPDGQLDWLMAVNSTGEEHGYQSFMERIDGIVMGRATFDTANSFDPWPYKKPLLVLSNKLDHSDISPDLAEAVTVVRSVPHALEQAQRNGWKRVYVDGGATISAFLEVGAISDLVITRVPIVLGTGIPLFSAVSKDIPLRHIVTRSFPSGLVQSTYEVSR